MMETFILFVVAVIAYIFLKSKKPNNFPPGPTPLPIVGNIYDFPKDLHLFQTLEKWSKQYGPVIGLSTVTDLLVCITGADNVIAALKKEEFQSRPDNFSLRQRSFGKLLGIFFSSGEQWTSSRKFSVKHLKAYGKNEKEILMANEIDQLIETLKDGSTIQVNGMFNLSAVNIIWMIIASKRLDIDDKKCREFLGNLYEQFRAGNPSGLDIVNIFPFLRYFSKKFKRSIEIFHDTQEFVREAINEHRDVLDPNNPMDLIDHYLVEMDQNKLNPYFSENDLIMIGLDLFAAGAESTSNSTEFVLLYMILYPEVQQRVQEELDRVLGRSRKPVLDDKAHLHYTMAVLNEVERCNTIAPTSVPHNATRDTTFNGYFIPKGTAISIDMWSLGHDPKYWKNPDEFNPDRFINEEGEYTRSPIFHPFGLGQRVCVGETIARNTIFIFVTTFLEKFTISLPPGEPRPSTLALRGFTTAPQPFKAVIKSRY